MFNSIQSVTGPLTLIAFLAAVAFYGLRARYRRDERVIKAAKPEDRGPLAVAAMRSIHVDLAEIPEQDRVDVALQELKNRSQQLGEQFARAWIALLCITLEHHGR